MVDSKKTKAKSFTQLEEEDFNNILQRNKGMLITIVLVLIVAVLGAGYYQNKTNKELTNIAGDVYNFKTNDLELWIAPEPDPKTDKETQGAEKADAGPKKSWEQVKASYDSLVAKHGHHSSLSPVILEMATELVKQNKKSEAFEIIQAHYEKIDSIPLVDYVLGNYYAGLSEDLGKTDKAIEINEKMLKAKQKFMEPKIYFDLGRLYKAKGNLEKAKSNLEYLIKNFSKDEIIPLAKVYLSEL
jgi:tetratricopeptide (TPR) repeat protein